MKLAMLGSNNNLTVDGNGKGLFLRFIFLSLIEINLHVNKIIIIK